MGNKMEFTQEELQLLYAACMSYGERLSGIIKSISNEGENIVNGLSDSGNLARKITEYMEEDDTKIDVVEVCP